MNTNPPPWSRNPPTKEGWFWFSGYVIPGQTGDPSLYMIKATAGRGEMIFSTCGILVRPSVAIGQWLEADAPVPPKL